MPVSKPLPPLPSISINPESLQPSWEVWQDVVEPWHGEACPCSKCFVIYHFVEQAVLSSREKTDLDFGNKKPCKNKRCKRFGCECF